MLEKYIFEISYLQTSIYLSICKKKRDKINYLTVS